MNEIGIVFCIIVFLGLLLLQFVVFALIKRKERKTQLIKDKINEIGVKEE
jgi:hypothetical protein